MASVDLQFVRARHRSIRQIIQRSSPVVLYQGTIGIVIIARTKTNRKMVRPRIGKVLDRLAIVSRGEIVACNALHNVAASEARTKAHYESKADVRGSDVANAVSEVLSQRYHAFLTAPLVAESCVIQLNDTLENDYLSHIGPDGSEHYFEKIHSMSSPDHGEHQEASPHATPEESDDSAPLLSPQEGLQRLNESLIAKWADVQSPQELIELLRSIPELRNLFAPGTSRDMVLLSREAYLTRTYDDIFQRLTLA